MPSQFKQDAIIEKIFNRIGTTNKFCVEFGHDSIDYGIANTGHLRLNKGWSGILFDSSNENPEINLHKEFITSKNIVEIFDKHKIPFEPDYVSIDIDSTDLWVFRAIIGSKYKPRVISVEYNCLFPWGVDMTVIDDPTFQWNAKDHVYGASLSALDRVAVEFGYTLVDVELPCDAFFVRSDIDSYDPPIIEFVSKTHVQIHDAIPEDRRKYFVDYRQWSRNKNLGKN